ncbi:hypothetical protein [Actinomycetospora callitridis]|uniref:hypothetical protein n=1 Tax=Actinomycetospora callitridis TaxID=913944 RepID=UPI002366AB76|nr:hypothetical protein [Actinomycetospora callitridis]MDD7916110.1 hypothetical protein [Actinomycetospora callitridis]
MGRPGVAGGGRGGGGWPVPGSCVPSGTATLTLGGDTLTHRFSHPRPPGCGTPDNVARLSRTAG